MCTLKVGNFSQFFLDLTALVDTGCKTNLIRTGVVPDSFFLPARNPVNFVAANKTSVVGGHRELFSTLHFDGVDPDTGVHQLLQIPFSCLDAEITGGDIVFSYQFLAQNLIDIAPRQHGLMVLRPSGPVWIAGIKDSQEQTPNSTQIHIISTQNDHSQRSEEWSLRDDVFWMHWQG